MKVPLDYSSPEGRQAAIALIRKPALVSEDSHLYRGPVLFNPGGPGGSGVDLIRNTGSLFSTILGPQFDIVGFDPRGMNPQLRVIEVLLIQARRCTLDTSG